MPNNQLDLPDAVPTPTVRRILRTIKDAEVVYLAFPRLRRALLFDLRRDADGEGSVTVMEYRTDLARQVLIIQALHPDIASSRPFASVSWGGSTRAFIEQGVLPALLNRLPESAVSEAMAAFEQMRAAERGTKSAPGTIVDTV